MELSIPKINPKKAGGGGGGGGRGVNLSPPVIFPRECFLERG